MEDNLSDGEGGNIGVARPVYVGVLLAFTLLVGAYFVYRIRVVVLVLLLTLLFSIIFAGPVGYIVRRWGIGRGWATLLVFGGTGLALYLLGLSIAPIIDDQISQLFQELPALVSEVQRQAAELQRSSGVDFGRSLEPERLFERARDLLSGDTFAVAADIGGSIANGLSLAFVALIATIYLVLNPFPLVNGFVALFPAGWRLRTREVLNGMYETVGRWFLGQLASMLIIGVLSAVALSIIGVRFALLLGLFSGLIAFIPFVGPVISVFPPVLLALTDQPVDALWVLAAYAGIQAVESNVIQPLVMSRAVSLHPAVVVFGLLAMGTLFGFVGLLLAVPLVAALHVLVSKLWIERMNEAGTDPDPPTEVSPQKPKQRRLAHAWRAVKARLRR